jgi:hypothetical protein
MAELLSIGYSLMVDTYHSLLRPVLLPMPPDSVRDRTRPPEAMRLNYHSARARPPDGVHRAARLEPGGLRRIRH